MTHFDEYLEIDSNQHNLNANKFTMTGILFDISRDSQICTLPEQVSEICEFMKCKFRIFNFQMLCSIVHFTPYRLPHE